MSFTQLNRVENNEPNGEIACFEHLSYIQQLCSRWL